MKVCINGKRLTLQPHQAIDKGGEADIFAFGKTHVLKIFKSPSHPDYAGQPQEQQQAELRLAEQQRKLPAFPASLPPRVVAPEALVTVRQHIVGYSMRYVRGADLLQRYSERSFRQQGVTAAAVVAIFQDLHHTLTALHHAGVVIGDFHDRNVLIQGTQAFLIDADSWQFAGFLCQMFTTRFVDPLLCGSQATTLVPCQPYTPQSDWYAFAVMLMQCLLFVGPYGGVYRPRPSSPRVPHEARPLHRLTVFHPEVQYPKPALPYTVLPDDVLHYLHLVFERDVREPFPDALLAALHWQACHQCGLEYARPTCPQCRSLVPVARSTPQAVTVQSLFHTQGLLLAAALHDDRLRWLVHEHGQLVREDGTIVCQGPLVPQMRYRLCGSTTLLGMPEQVMVVRPGQPPERLAVDRQAYDANAGHYYWIAQGQLWRDDVWGPTYIGDVLAGHTQFWVGSHFGFGLYRVGAVQVAFLFDAQRRGLRDTVPLPPLQGHWLEATCVFTDNLCWFFIARQLQGSIVHQCFLVSAAGQLLASAEAIPGDGSWLGTLPGKDAAGAWLFAPTDNGIVRVEAQGAQLLPTRFFAETEPFVDSGCQVYVSPHGMLVIDQQDIRLLTIQP